ncbi:MAG TPA: GH1 family beta-glucosidase [Pseudolysinimonas sp.]|nr:GH1 family beta-glucosidase [Pseudolysinimonas sp.]
MHDPAELARALPAGFRLGAATSAFQIEGADAEDGKGPSSWDVFTREPGRIVGGADARVSTDHYHRFREDVALLKDLGVDSYRFSISWPRIQPTGQGPVEPRGLAFYDRLIDELLEAGIRPSATLFHWDTPAALEEKGGWRRRDTAYRFAEYARIAGEEFGDRVDEWVTINEISTITLEGYGTGDHAPGLALSLRALPVAYHLLLAHGLAVHALREVPVLGRIGVAGVHSTVEPATPRLRDRLAASVFDYFDNRLFVDPILLGRLPRAPRGAAVLTPLLRLLMRPHRGDLAVISEPIDFYGMNYYFPSKVAAGPPDASVPFGLSQGAQGGPLHITPWPDHPATGYGWPVVPEGLTAVLRMFAQRYGDALPPLVITEGGASYPDAVRPDGTVDDAARIDYLARHIAAALAATPEVDVRGYYVWSLLDNFEWAAGYSQRFGLVHVDFDTLLRTPKRSYEWLRQVLAERSRIPDPERDRTT